MDTDIKVVTKEIVSRVKVYDVARLLGLNVSHRGSGPHKVLCPFHDDHTPSLSLFDDHYHCFACGAHGNVFDLIKAILRVNFVDARNWIANEYGFHLPTPAYVDKHYKKNPRINGLSIALEKYKNETVLDKKILKEFALQRGFESIFLHAAEVFGVKANKLSRQLKAMDNYEALNDLLETGLIYQLKPKSDPNSELPLIHPYQDTYYTDRIVFTIRTAEGDIAGFAGRAIADDKPKYLFSRGLPKGELLYRLDVVRKKHILTQKTKHSKAIHLYVVEGLLDALRIESLGLPAVAILGSRITKRQTDLLVNFARDLERLNQQLVIHLFLDTDEAGMKGTTTAIESLWTAAQSPENLIFVLDIIFPYSQENDGAHDPDEYLKKFLNIEEAKEFLTSTTISCLDFLISQHFQCKSSDIATVWNSISQIERLACMRKLDRLGDGTFWQFVFSRLSPFSVFVDGQAAQLEPEWVLSIKNFLLSNEPVVRHAPPPYAARLENKSTLSEKERISHALKLATSSIQRRDIPVDEGSWLRMNLASDIFEEHFKMMLTQGSSHDEPLTAVKIPKRVGEFRLKALPCQEDLVLQQYIMNALLCDYPQSHKFLEWIPAIRFNRYERGSKSILTGPIQPQNDKGTISSFAYQIDMDVLEGRTPPGNSGMFRHYAECWREFIRYLDSQIANFEVRDLHVARLDIRKYYDQLPLFAVRDALLNPLEKALGFLDDPSQCAPEFCPEVSTAEKRARLIVDWLCKQSFGYQYYDPSDGTLRSYNWKDRGIPQGPDLSAYLANIALFPLDKAVNDHIDNLNRKRLEIDEKQKTCATYARYVDDLILITDSAEILTDLQIIIERELSTVGLELNKKTAPLPSMSQADVRQWLTDERGGLGVSTPSQTPTVDFETLVNDCIESGHVDRQDSLLLLHSPRMDDPDTDPGEVLDGVRASRESQELRYGDLCSAAKHIWRVVLAKALEENTFEEMTQQFFKYWNDTGRNVKSSNDEVKNFFDVYAVLVALDGVERFLRSRADRNPTFSATARQKHGKWRKQLAKAVLSGDIKAITLHPRPDAHFTKEMGIHHMTELKRLSIVHAACAVLHDEPSSTKDSLCDIEGSIKITPPIMRHLCSVAALCENKKSLEWAAMSPDSAETASGPILLLHNAIARLQISNAYDDLDPLDGLKGLFDNLYASIREQNTSKCATHALELWMPHKNGCQPEVEQLFLQQALRSFINIAEKNRIAEYIGRRSAFSNALLDGAVPFPAPPGINYPGILGWDKIKDEFIRVDFIDGSLFAEIDGLNWNKREYEAGTTQWTYLRASAEGWSPLTEYIPQVKDICTHKNAPEFCAALFFGLYNVLLTDEQNIVPCAAPHILVRKFNKEDMSFSSVAVLGYRLPKDSFTTSAFIRRGNSLVQEGVSDRYADIWRIGSTVTDTAGFLEYCHADRSMHLTKKSYISDCEFSTAHWARETLLRTALYRLQGKKIRPGVLRVDPNTKLPMTAARAVTQLKNFPKSDNATIDNSHLQYVISSSTESRAMALRMADDVAYNGPGGAAFFLLHFASHYFREDEVLASLLPKLTAIVPETLQKRRRSVLGYFELARRLWLLMQDRQTALEFSGLTALSAGLWILALTENIRAQVLERLHLLSGEDFCPFEESLGLESFGIDTQSVLIAEELRNQQAELVKRIKDLIDGKPISTVHLGKTTPLGWWALLLALCGFSEIPFARAVSCKADRSKYETLTKALLLWDDNSADFPWEGLSSTLEQWTESFAREQFAILDDIDLALGVDVAQPSRDSVFSYSVNNRKGTVDFNLPTGRRTLKSWLFFFSSIGGKIRDVEFEFDSIDKSKKYSIWTETRVNGDLIAVSAMSSSLATLADIRSESMPAICDFKGTGTTTDLLADVTIKKSEMTEVDITEACVPDNDSILKENPDVKTKSISATSGATSWFHILEKMQHDSWKVRQEDTRIIAGHVRIALLQMEIDSSYDHPIVELCIKSKAIPSEDANIANCIKEIRKDITKWDSNLVNKIYETHSCAEYRRRKILEEVLRACGTFQVDILVLPEYSVRPETVEWISKQLPEFAPKMSVWAGTFRKPPYMIGNCADRFKNAPDWAAPIPVVFPNDGEPLATHGVIHVVRWKKYPAAGLGEVFNPYQDGIEPISWKLKNPQGYGDHRDLVCELICSEIFLLTSPSNLLSLGVRLRALHQKFGLSPMAITDIMEKIVLLDCGRFSYFTSLQTPKGFRRHPIIIVPACTTRPVDWAVTGQAGYLASGLTTIFCNAVNNQGKGQSCFIGTDCWDNDRKKPLLGKHNAQLGPYHGVMPGIYNQTTEDRGWLRGEEQALVIADIDPIHSCGGNPSPESLGSSLTLVAHLPIIESSKPIVESDGNSCRCSRNHDNLKEKFDRLMDEIANRLQTIKGPTSIEDNNPQILVRWLEQLAQIVPSNNYWLKERATAYLNHHAADPAPWPPPVALDWLWVEIDYNKGPMPVICMPEYRKAPGETTDENR